MILKKMALAAIVLLACTAAGCSQTGNGSASTDGAAGTEASARGRYLEEDVKLPEGAEYIQALCQLEDGSLRGAFLGQNEGNGIWDTKDKGKTWKKAMDYPKEMTGTDTKSLTSVALSPKGGVAGIIMDYSGLDSTTGQGTIKGEYMILGKDEKVRKLDVKLDNAGGSGQEENILSSMYLDSWKYVEENKLAGLGSDGKIYILNTEDGSILQKIENKDGYFGALGAVGNTLAAYDGSGVYYYDISNGKALDKDAVLNEKLSGGFDTSAYTSGGSKVVFDGREEGQELYYCNKEGIFRHILNGNVSEQLVDGSLNSLSNPSLNFMNLTAMKDGDFFVSSSEDDGTNHMFRYSYSKDVPSVPEKEVKLYALRDNPEVRQAITLFQKSNPDTRATLEIGISEEGAVTVSDALRVLNTNIMAGKGPDVLIMDGISQKAYREKGLLADLSAVLEPIAASEGFFENIKEEFTQDGGIYVMPTRFSIPAIQAKADDLADITDLKTLAQKAQALKKANPAADLFGGIEPKALAEKLYDVCACSWIKEDGTLDEAKVKEYLTCLKEIYDCGQDNSNQNGGITTSVSADFDGAVGIGSQVLDFMSGKILMNIGNISSIDVLAELGSCNAKIKDGGYQALSGQSKNIFVPGTMLGISSKASNRESAEKFAAFMLSKEAQSVGQGHGFPVNKKAFEQILSEKRENMMSIVSMDDKGEMVGLDVKWPSGEELQKLQTTAEGLTTAANTDSVIKEAVIVGAEECLGQEKGVDEAVNGIMQKVDLYLSE